MQQSSHINSSILFSQSNTPRPNPSPQFVNPLKRKKDAPLSLSEISHSKLTKIHSVRHSRPVDPLPPSVSPRIERLVPLRGLDILNLRIVKVRIRRLRWPERMLWEGLLGLTMLMIGGVAVVVSFYCCDFVILDV